MPRLPVRFACALILIPACQAPPDNELSSGDAAAADVAEPPRGSIGKADLPGSCEVDGELFCAGPSSDRCWCDELCVDFGDCCADYEPVCECAPLTCEEVDACGSIDDGCGGTLECEPCAEAALPAPGTTLALSGTCKESWYVGNPVGSCSYKFVPTVSGTKSRDATVVFSEDEDGPVVTIDKVIGGLGVPPALGFSHDPEHTFSLDWNESTLTHRGTHQYHGACGGGCGAQSQPANVYYTVEVGEDEIEFRLSGSLETKQEWGNGCWVNKASFSCNLSAPL